MITKPKRPMPEDFTEIAPTMTKSAMARHYRTKIEIIKRWLGEAQIEAAAPKFHPPRNAKHTRWNGGYKRSYGNMVQTVTFTIYDEAADTLRRFCPVYRCTERGAADPKGAFWRMGMSIMTPDELLVRAERKRAA